MFAAETGGCKTIAETLQKLSRLVSKDNKVLFLLLTIDIQK
jgi:hypothetical protein